MVNCGDWPVGVCSWSLRMGPLEAAGAMNKLGVEHVHLAIGPALRDGASEYLSAVGGAGWKITSTMIDFPQEDYSTLESIKLTGGIVPDEHWQDNRRLFLKAAEITAELSAPYISMHAGFIDLGRAEHARKFYDRVGELADAAGDKQIMLLLETGQESARELREFLEELAHPYVGVNFDPANVILYDRGDPNEAVRVLSPWVRHVHIKDAVRTTEPGSWGTEVPWGDGQVGADKFLEVLKETGFEGALAVEREAGDDRYGDIKLAVERLSNFNG